jgi:hypothetical protein
MIEISDGFTSISAGSDGIGNLEQAYSSPSAAARAPRRPTGARVTVEFSRTSSLSPRQAVTVRYDFTSDGNVRELIGIPKPIRTEVRHGRAVRYHYRLSHWIAASELMGSSGAAPHRAIAHHECAEPPFRGESGRAPMLTLAAAGAAAIDQFPV